MRRAFSLVLRILHLHFTPMMMSSSFILSMTTSSQLVVEKEDYMYKFGMAEDDSTYVYTKDVSESEKPSTPVTKGTILMSDMSTPVMKPSVKWQRKIKLLPNSFADMTSVDSHHLVMSEELDPHSKSKTYGKSLHVVSRAKGIGQNDEDIVLDQLTTDQVHLFARNIGVPNLGSKNKFVCCLTIVSHSVMT